MPAVTKPQGTSRNVPRALGILAAPMIVALGLASLAARGAPAAPDDTVAVVLTENAIEMPDSITEGDIVFEITNEGEAEHSLAIRFDKETGLQPQEPPEGLPQAQLEREPEVLANAGPSIPPGASAVMQVALEPGAYVAFCPVEDHKDRGESHQLTVTASAPPVLPELR